MAAIPFLTTCIRNENTETVASPLCKQDKDLKQGLLHNVRSHSMTGGWGKAIPDGGREQNVQLAITSSTEKTPS